jgi:argininosuccinate lyase
MPQKRNPDSLELVRGKAAQLLGRLAGMLATLKAMPAGYQKDLQDNNAALFDALDGAYAAADLMEGVVAGLTLQPGRMAAALDAGSLATDLADLLVQAGRPFREAHGVVGALVRRGEELGVPIDRVPVAEAGAIDPGLPPVLARLGDAEAAVERRRAAGGTARAAVLAQLEAAAAAFSG